MAEFKLSVIMPVFNERATIVPLLERLRAVPLPLEVIVVDDGSTDGTRALLEQNRRLADHLVLSDANHGKGHAIRMGLAMATGPAVIIQDADLEYDPAEFVQLVEPVIQRGARAVYGSRILKRNPKCSWLFYLGGRFLSLVTNLLYGTRITDEPTCYKLIETATLRRMNLRCEGFEFCPEVTAKLARLGIPIVEIPVTYNPRGVAEGKKIRFRDAILAVWTLLRYRFWKP